MATCSYCLNSGAQGVDLDGDPICDSCVAPDVVVCPACNGRGGQYVRWHNGLSYWQPCAVCDEKCVIPANGGGTP